MPKDFLFNMTTGEPLIEDGDFVVGDSTAQHQYDLLRLQKGELKQFPKAGVGVIDFFDDENPDALLREMRKQYSADGMKVNDLNLQTNGSIATDASYDYE